jgi:hypothetical protein
MGVQIPAPASVPLNPAYRAGRQPVPHALLAALPESPGTVAPVRPASSIVPPPSGSTRPEISASCGPVATSADCYPSTRQFVLPNLTWTTRSAYDGRWTIACPSRQTHLYVARAESRALRLAVQDIALSRRKHGFDSRRARQLITSQYQSVIELPPCTAETPCPTDVQYPDRARRAKRRGAHQRERAKAQGSPIRVALWAFGRGGARQSPSVPGFGRTKSPNPTTSRYLASTSTAPGAPAGRLFAGVRSIACRESARMPSCRRAAAG